MGLEHRSDVGSRRPLDVGFLALETFGWSGSLIILLTVIFSNVRRHITWINFCMSWMLSSLSYCLLLFARQDYGPEPNHILCLVQSPLIYAAPTLTAGTTLALVIHLWLNVRASAASNPNANGTMKQVGTVLLVIFPYITPVAIITWVLVYGLQNPGSVYRGDASTFCGLNIPTPGRVSAGFVSITTFSTVSFETIICTMWVRTWRRSYTQYSRKSFTAFIRVMAFSLFGFFSIAISLAYLGSPHHKQGPSIMMALLPAAFVVIFGTQMDLIHVWMFWRPRAAEFPSTSESIPRFVVDSKSLEMASVEVRDSFHTRGKSSDQNGDPWRVM